MGGLGGFLGGAIGGIGGFLLAGPAGAIAGAGVGAQIGGGADANAQAAENTAAANASSLQSTREQIAFQERMSSTAHQREVEDLTKAGLNPLLSANAGSSSPAGASMQSQAAQVQNVAQGAGQSAYQLATMAQSLNKTDSEIKLNQALSQKANVEAKVSTKGIPEADLKNRLYNLGEPALKWLEEKTHSNAPKALQPKRTIPFGLH